MKIILMRHGQAEDATRPDSMRTLTDFGQEQARQTADYLARHYAPDVIVVSPFLRAQQTAAQLKDKLQSKDKLSDVRVITQDNITPSDDAKTALMDLADIECECMVVVCHMSIVANIASLLTGHLPEGFRLAEARVFEMEFVMTGMADECDRFVPDQP